MSRIEKLIEALCPDGVEFKELGEVLDYEQPTNYIVESTNYDNSFSTPVLTAGQTFILGYTDEKVGIYQAAKDCPVIIFDDFTTSFHWVDFDFKVKSSAMKILTAKKDAEVDFRFIFHAMKCITYNPKDHARQWISVYSKFPIPLPPLPIQQEIVTILDTFTALDGSLQAELEARRKQYEHYRNQLLNFEGKEVEWKMLGEVGKFIRGKRFVKNDIVSEGVPCIHYGEMYTYYKTWTKKTKSFLELEKAEKLRLAKPGDVIIVTAGETIEDIGNAVAWLGETNVVIHDACFAYSHNFNPKFVSYYFQTDIFRSQIRKHISSSKISAILESGLRQAKIPIPSLSEQERIVGILDKFDALANTELPAEIAARRKQYEYYREKLLTFEPLTN